MSWAPHVVTVFGIPIRLNPLFFLVAVVLGPRPGGELDWTLTGWWVAIVTGSILWHELGHAAAMLAAGIKPSIELGPMGGLTRWDEEARPSAKVRLLVSLAGPAAGLSVAVLLLAAVQLGWGTEANGWILSMLLAVNGVWTLVNLLPMLPWDGGLAAEAALEMKFPRSARRVAGGLTLAVAAPLALLAIQLDYVWGLLLLGLSGMQGWAALQSSGERGTTSFDLEPVTRAVEAGRFDEARHRVRTGVAAGLLERSYEVEMLNWLGHRALDAGNVAGARRCLDALAPDGHADEQLLACVLVEEGNASRALPMLERLFESAPTRNVGPLALAYVRSGRVDDAIGLLGRFDADRHAHHAVTTALFYSGYYRAAAEVAEKNFSAFSQGIDAFNAACSWARLGETDAAFEWLAKAIHAGVDDVAMIRDDEDLMPLHADDRFERLLLEAEGTPGTT